MAAPNRAFKERSSPMSKALLDMRSGKSGLFAGEKSFKRHCSEKAPGAHKCGESDVARVDKEANECSARTDQATNK